MTRAPLSHDYDGVPDLPPRSSRLFDALLVIAVAAVLIVGLFVLAL